jgi:methionyl-tRNA formyltransferase
MKKISEPILFFGSGPVAAESLRFLSRTFVVEAVITKPAPPHHRGDVPVATLAKEIGIKTYFVRNKVELSNLFRTDVGSARLGVLVDFGIIVPQLVIDHFRLGIVNSHFSLLPQWRGADPITFAVLSGQQETGVSLMLLVEAMDEGPLLAQSPCELPSTITTPELTEQLIELSNFTLGTVLPLYIEGKAAPIAQDDSIAATYSRKLTKEDGIINWQKPAIQIERDIRAFIDWPKSHTNINKHTITITQAHVQDVTGPPGKVSVVNKALLVYCGKQALIIDRLKPAGKKEMTSQAFLAGYQVIS